MPFIAAEPPPGWNALSFAQRIVAWQRSHGRNGLPWQQTRDPYRVWLSEIMLQQTQVTTVLGYYARFLERFPDVATLAAAPVDDVLALWSGLGYYARARNLHRCAQVVASEHGGRFPRTAHALAALPGIGRSTAAAIAAFCFGERVAILDGNVKRVLSRVQAFDGDLASATAERALWDIATSLLPEEAACPPLESGAGVHGIPEMLGSEQARTQASAMGAYTQGLMDLGATLCVVRSPACHACPAAASCRAALLGEPERFPVKTRRLRRGKRSSALLWLRQEDRAWLVRRPVPGVWAGLWSMPEFDDAADLEHAVRDWPGTLEWLAPVKHVLTHFDWTLQPLRLTWHGAITPAAQREIEALRAIAAMQDSSPGRWFAGDDLAQAGLPSPIRRLLRS